MIRRQFLTEDQLDYLANCDSAEDEASGEEVDHLSESDHSTDSEQDLEIDDNNDMDITSQFDSNLGSNASQISKTRSQNIIRFKCGPNISKQVTDDVNQLFSAFISDQMIRDIIYFTNKEIDLKRNHYKSNPTFIYSTDALEMKAFIGLLLLAGVYRSNGENAIELWATDGGGRDIFRSVMPLQRFKFLLICIRFDDREDRDKNDKLSAFRDIFEAFICNCKKNYTLSEYVTIDEQLRAFRGKCSFRQYMPQKPAKYGLKLFMICDAKTSYMYDSEVYLGKQPNADRAVNLGQQIVMRLTRDLKNTGRNITCDNWFTSFDLANELLNNNLTIVGTIRANKPQIPKEFKTYQSNRGVDSSLYKLFGGINLLSWIPPKKKKKNVLLISTLHNTESLGEKGKPEIVEFYNSTKGGVDNVDKLCVTFTTGRGTHRWPLCLFYDILDIAGINSYIIYKHYFPNDNRGKYRREFLKHLGRSLVYDLMKSRLNVPNLRHELRTTISRVSGNLMDLSIPQKDPITKSFANNSRCDLCPRDRDRRASKRCEGCERLVCQTEHMVIYCSECKAEDYLIND